MEIAGLIAGIVGALAGVAAAIIAVLAIRAANRVAKRQEDQQQEQTSRQAEYQRRVNALNASIRLRDILGEWYETIRQNINPDRSPDEILDYIEEGYHIKHFEQQFETQFGLIEAANEPLCVPILNQADIFYKDIFRKKQLEKREGVLVQAARNPNLDRLYHIIQRSKEAGQEPNRELCEEYVEEARKDFEGVYFRVDKELGSAIKLLSKKINQTS